MAITLKHNNKQTQPQQNSDALINEKIRAERVQLIDEKGENIGVVSRSQALRMAQEASLDLVLLSESGKDNVPVVKIMDFGKVLYERKKKQADAKKNQKVIQIKEVKLRPKIGEHDYLIKIKQAIQFLNEGKRVKFTLSFKGRENVLRDERGNELFDKIDRSLEQADLSGDLVKEQDSKLGQLWSRVYYLKTK